MTNNVNVKIVQKSTKNRLYNKCWGVQQIELEKNKNFQKSRAYLFKILYNGIVEKP